MEVYLVQHGEAKSEIEGPLRPLNEKGSKEVSEVAEIVANKGLRVGKIYHSNKLRAKQTAEIFAHYLGIKEIVEIEGIAPLDDLSVAKKLVEEAENSIMIVGHLPHLSRLASMLVIGEPQKEIVKFKMGGVLGLKREKDHWIITCFFIPCI